MLFKSKSPLIISLLFTLTVPTHATVTWDGTNGIFLNVITNNGVENCTSCHHSSLSNGNRQGGSAFVGAYDAPINANFDSYTILSSTNTSNYSGTLLDTFVSYINTGFMPYRPSDYQPVDLSVDKKTLTTSWQTDGYLQNAEPDMTIGSASSISNTAATISGAVNENGYNVTVSFLYRENGIGSYSALTPSSTSGSGSVSSVNGTNSGGGNEPNTSFTRSLTGLSCGTTYQYYIRAIGNNTTTNSAVNTFDTSPCSKPIIRNTSNTSISSTTVTMSEDNSPTSFFLNLRASDVDGGTRTWSISSQGSKGTASVSGTTTSNTENKTINYTVTQANYNGSDSFIVQVTDDSGLTNTATVNVTIQAVNDAPSLLTNSSITVSEGKSGIVTTTQLDANDVDDIDSNIIYRITSTPTRGDLRINSTVLSASGVNTFTQQDILDGNISYIETANTGTGSDSFIFNLADDSGAVGASNQTFTIKITLNAPPTVTAGSTLNFIEGKTASVIDNSITVADAENDNIIGGTVTISSGYAGNEDVLSLGNTNLGIAATYNAGSLTLSGSASTSTYQTALRSVRYFNNSDDPSDATRTISYQLNDNTGSSSNVTSTVNVTPINNAPNLSATGTNPTFTENASSVDLYHSVNADTGESNQRFSDLTLSITNLRDGANEILNADQTAIALTNGHSGVTKTNGLNFNISLIGNTAIVTFSGGSLTSAAMSTLIDGITYENISDNPTATANRVATIKSLKDNGGVSNKGVDTTSLNISTAVAIIPVNDPPTITSTNEPSTAIELNAFSFTPILNEPDDLNDGSGQVSWSLNGEPVGMTISDVGVISWTPPLGATSSGLVTISVEDGNEDNSPPDTANFTIVVLKDDPDGDNVSATIDNCPSFSNTDQLDTDNDGIGDACDPDNGNDGLFESGIKFTTTQNSIESSFVFLDVSSTLINISATAAQQGIDFSSMSFTWSLPQEISALPSYLISNDSMSFDPTELNINTEPVVYEISLTISNGTSFLSDAMLLTIYQTGPTSLGYFDCNGNNENDGVQELFSGDCDADGLTNNDPLEGYNDLDNDGIPNFLDSNLPANIINDQTGDISNAYEITTNAGYALRLGKNARYANRNGILISANDLINFGNKDNSLDNNVNEGFSGIGGIYSYEIAELTPGDNASIVIPLPTSLPPEAIYRKFIGNEWSSFVFDDQNFVKSSPFVGGIHGICPEPNDTKYTDNLTPYHNCIQITIQDGGPNDIDGVANGVIRDTSGSAISTSGGTRDTFDEVEGGGTISLVEILLLLFFASLHQATLKMHSFKR